MQETISNLRKLNWNAAANNYALRQKQALDENVGYDTFIDFLIEDELAFRMSRDYEQRLKASLLDPMMTLDLFDFPFNACINKKEIYAYATCKFITDRKNLIFFGNPGCGKTHLGSAICHEALKKGFSVLCYSMEDLIRDILSLLHSPLSLERLVKKFLKPDVLFLDEMAISRVPYQTWGTLYRIINERYKKQMSLIITSNRAFSRWAEMFLIGQDKEEKEDIIIPSALIQRMVHRSYLIKIEGKSYRLKEFDISDQEKIEMPLKALESTSTNPDKKEKNARVNPAGHVQG